MRFRSRFLASSVIALVFGLLFSAGPALAACDPDNALFADDFEYFDGTWGEPSDVLFAQDGVMYANVAADSWLAQVNFSTTSQEANVCVDATTISTPDPDNSPVGLIFWWLDWDNYYMLYTWPTGDYTVWRIYKGKSSFIIGDKSSALKAGVGQTNSLEIRIKPKDATIVFNGTEIKRFKGFGPKDGGPIGLVAVAPKAGPASFKFDNLVVSAPTQ